MKNAKRTPEYEVWKSMRKRCYLKTHKFYQSYGGRGISVCDAWRNSFVAFLEHVGPRPSAAHSIDRIDSNGNYEPGNVRWATHQTQMRNRRNNRWVTLNGRTECVTAWVEILGVPWSTFQRRCAFGLTDEQALTHRRGAPVKVRMGR